MLASSAEVNEDLVKAINLLSITEKLSVSLRISKAELLHVLASVDSFVQRDDV